MRTPTLVIYGEHELRDNVVFARETAQLVPDCALRTITGASHMDAYLKPEYTSAVCKFIERNASDPSSDPSPAGE